MADVQTMLRKIADAQYGERLKTIIDRLSKDIGLSPVRTREIWYGYHRRLEQHEYEKIKTAYLRNRIYVAEKGILELENTISSLKALLRATDEDFHRPTLDALRGVRGRVV